MSIVAGALNVFESPLKFDLRVVMLYVKSFSSPFHIVCRKNNKNKQISSLCDVSTLFATFTNDNSI